MTRDDLISRQAAIEELDKIFDSIPIEQTIEILKLRRTLRELPSAQPKEQKRIRGKWIYCEDSIADCVDGYRCDCCGFFVPWDYTHKSTAYINDYNFCPNCGAEMKGENNG